MKSIAYIFIFLSLKMYAQDSIKQKTAIPELHGYIKYMNQFSFIDDPGFNNSTSLIHNRLNFKWAPRHWLFRLEARNRLFYGDQLKSDPLFMKNIGNDKGAVNLSTVWIDKFGFGATSALDRALINYNSTHWDITVGRQRINWGLNMIWNPNDVFNTYNFFDFDYEERPGSDAVRVQYMWKGFSAIEVAARKGKADDDYTAALLFRSNSKGYDYQILCGASGKDLFAGAGWAGNIRNAGFKGELTYFHPYENLEDTNGILSSCLSIDYSFKKGWYLNLSAYYNTNGSDKISFLNTQQLFNVSAKQLLPFKYSGFLQLSKQINPLFTVGLSNIYSPTNNSWVIVPNIQYSISGNWDISLIGQCFFSDMNNVYRSMGNSIFLRLKCSF